MLVMPLISFICFFSATEGCGRACCGCSWSRCLLHSCLWFQGTEL